MIPVKPDIPGADGITVVYAEGQAEYQPLPVVRMDNAVMSRWTLTDEERKHIADGGDLFICCMNFGGPLQPILPIADTPEHAMQIMIEATTE
jgi:hypothetical protein